MPRLVFVDMIRGFACLFMIFFQLLDMFGNYDLYGRIWFHYFNWVSIFMVIAG